MHSWQIHIFARMTSFTCTAPSPELELKAQEGATQHAWECEFWTVSEVERATEGTGAPRVLFFRKLRKIMFPFFSPSGSPASLSSPLLSSPPLVVLPYASCSPSFSHFLFLLTKNEGKSANPVLAELELCVQAAYIEFFFPLSLFPFLCDFLFNEIWRRWLLSRRE